MRLLFHPASRPRGELLARAGEPPRHVAFVHRGLVRLYFTGSDGQERTYGFRDEGHLVCAHSAVRTAEPATMSIETLEACELLIAPHRAFRELCESHAYWRQLSARLTEALYVQQLRRQRELLMDDAATRYRNFVATYPAMAGRLTQRQIAAYIGITPVALSRLRSRLIRVNDAAPPGS